MSDLLVKMKGDPARLTAALTKSFAATAGEAPRVVLSLPARSAGPGMAPGAETHWLRVSLPDTANPWDAAHAAVRDGSRFAAAAGVAVEFAEPDIAQQWGTEGPGGPPRAGMSVAPASGKCGFDEQDPSGGRAVGPGPAWNLGDAYSQLAAARRQVDEAAAKRVRIAHLDTGYDDDHATRPKNLNPDLGWDFVEGMKDATDRVPPGLLNNPGHGPGTLSLLAGNRLKKGTLGFETFDDWLGGAPFAEIIPIRIADSVVRFSTRTMVEGIGHAVAKNAHVLTMSMGGLASEALADAVNLAYDSGLVMVTAAGNNFSRVPSPKSVVFPARFTRVIAACGVMADGRAYAGLEPGTMQGNYGPDEKMKTALGAYTPNVPWAQIGCPGIVDMNGAGTSAATPQIAAAAALWLAAHWDEVMRYPQAWMRVEAVRAALFASAAKKTARMSAQETFETLGQGVMQAAAALAIAAPKPATLTRSHVAESHWPWLNLLFGTGGVTLTHGGPLGSRAEMLALELTQMTHRFAAVEEAIPTPEADPATISAAQQRRFLEAALDAGKPSNRLRAVLEKALSRPSSTGPLVRKDGEDGDDGGGGGRPFGAAPPVIERRPASRVPPHRRLRIFAVDPSLGQKLETIDINQAVIEVPWDDEPTTRDGLKPGPVGEYLEVVDVDPASDRVYAPIDLNDRMVLAQDGLAPSEGNPQFHQQMVYAVAMKTIGHFEAALGRKALWAAQRGAARGEPDREVPRLRLHPHALRTANAYYSPDKKAVLFGYFSATGRVAGSSVVPGNLIFSCLSSDVIAHEVSHALLDGLHRRFQEASNPDVPAFHEAFADIVAIFQRFTMPELVRFAVAKARGDLSAARLLSELAKQFGEGTGISGALRDYLDPDLAKKSYDTTLEAHGRGQILVAAVYDAFRAIVARRTADLFRIATNGTAVLAAGALHPDLVERLTKETCTAAGHVLTMCIRALDYCPNVDITFGDYLRALITADHDLVADDRLGYRVAFIEAFRNRGIPVRGIRTMSTQSLLWDVPKYTLPPTLQKVLVELELGLDRDFDRSELFNLAQTNRFLVWRALDAVFRSSPDDCWQFGLMPGVPKYRADGTAIDGTPEGFTNFEVHSVRAARRVAPGGRVFTDLIMVINQRRPIPYDGVDVKNGFFWFRGGATLLIDPDARGKGAPRGPNETRGRNPTIRFAIVKSSGSQRRIEQQRGVGKSAHLSPLRALYFGDSTTEPFAMMHADHRGGDHE